MNDANTRKVKLVATSDNAAPTIEFHRSVAVIIGINAYSNGIPPLRTAQADAQRLAQILGEQHDYETVLLTNDVSGSRVRSLLQKELPQRIGKDDRLLFYFAGHGIALDGDDGPAGYLIPQDADADERATFLPMQEVHDALAALDCRHCLVILDCCFSGAFRWAAGRSLATPPKTLYRERYERFLRSPAWQVLTSAAYDQEALDALVGSGFGSRDASSKGEHQHNHSPFALALFDALTGNGDQSSDANGDGVIAATELYLYLRDNVEIPAETVARHRQTPGLWPLQKHDKGEYLFLLGEPDLPPAPELTAKNNPYRGLKSYDANDAELFFGRTALIKQLAKQVDAQSLTVVLGASGTGKSSVVKAGVAPYLTRTAHQEDKQAEAEDNGLNQTEEITAWHALDPLRPTEMPLQAFAELLAEHVTGTSEVLGTLTPEVYIETALTNWLSAHPEQKLLLIVDQFEELVTLCRDTDERTRFQALLNRLLDKHPDQLRIVLTLRTDFEPQFAESPLAERWRQSRFVVPPMTQADLREVIEGPAGVRVLFFEPPELVDRLIDEVIQTPGALPLLSFTLEQLYLKYLKRQEAAQAVDDIIERALTEADYDELGGVIGSLRTRADEEYKTLPDDAHRATMERVMLRMVAVEGGELARRRVPMSELVYPSAEENARVETIIAQLVEARLLVTDSTDADGDGVADAHVEPAHDALVRAWDRLRRWHLAAEEELPLVLHRNLAQVADEWERADEKAQNGLLWNENPWLPQLTERILPEVGERIDALSYWLDPSLLFRILVQVTTKPTRFNQQETLFIQQSARRRTFLWRQLVGITLAVMVGLTGLAGLAELQRRTAVERANIATSQQLAIRSTVALADHNTELALGLAIEAGRTFASNEAFSVIRDVITQPENVYRIFFGHTDAVRDALWNKDESKVLTRSDDNTVRIWDADSTEQLAILRGHEKSITSMAWSKDESKVLTASMDNTARIWEAATGEELVAFRGHTDGLEGAKWNADESTVLTWSWDDTARIWDAFTGKQLVSMQGHEGLIYEATWSKDQSKVLTRSTDDTVRIWNAATGEQLTILQGHRGLIFQATWNEDESQVLTASMDRTALVWDADSGRPLVELQGHTDSVGSAIWSHDESKILTASSGGTARIWDAASGGQLVILQGHEDDVGSAIWNRDESKVLTTSNDQTARVWDAKTGTQLAVLQGHEASVYEATWSKDESQILTRANDTTARIWDVVTGRQLVLLHPPQGSVAVARWSKDESKVLTSSDANTARIWDVRSGSRILIPQAHDGRTNQMLWNRDESKILTSGQDNRARIWAAATGQQLVVFEGHTDGVSRAKWNKDESKLLTVSYDHTARIWNAVTGRQLVVLKGQSSAITDATWNKDESKVLTYSSNGISRLWDATNGTQLVLFAGHTSIVTQAIWNQDESRILTTSYDGTARVWDATTGQPLAILEGHNDRVYPAAWNRDESRILTAGYDGMARVWDATTGRELLLLAGHTEPIYQIAWLQNDRKILTVSYDNTARIWDANTGTWQSVLLGHKKSIMRAMWNRAQSQIIRPSYDTVRVWDIETGEPQLVLVGHTNWVNPAFWSQDESRILTSDFDGSVRIWDANTGQQLFMLSAPQESINETIWSQDESKMLVRDSSGSIWLWELPTFDPLNMEDLLAIACTKAAHNLTWDEWERHFETAYRPTCVKAAIPADSIEGITNEVKDLAQVGNLSAAAKRLSQLVVWLRANGQFNTFGVERVEWLAALEAGENPWVEE